MQIIEHAFKLYKGESSNADALVAYLPYIFVMAKIERLLAHYNYIEAFHLTTNGGEVIEVYRTNLKITIQRIWDFKLPDTSFMVVVVCGRGLVILIGDPRAKVL